MNESDSQGRPPMGPLSALDPASGAMVFPAFAEQYADIVPSGRYKQLALWFLDIRNFRSVNPKYGFPTGNGVLQAVTRSLQQTFGASLPIARLGGDRFIALTNGPCPDEAQEAFERFLGRFEAELRLIHVNNPLNVSAGVYFLRACDYGDPSHQGPLDYASIAHRNAREHPQNSLVVFSDEDLERDRRRVIIEQTIDDALINRQIEVWYQPQIDYALSEVVGAEALARWEHPELGWISPAEFIPVLEECGRSHALALYVWEEACRSASKWRNAADGKPVPISVNVSRLEMFEPGMLERFMELQAKYELPASSLRLEVTESAFMEEADRLCRVIERIRKADMQVEMDNFGSGLSSLSMLKDAPVDVVKIDMGLMQSATNEDRGGVVLGSVIRLLQGLDTPIIAEGVETLEQAEMLKNMGCHLMQGYHFSRPMPLEDFEAFIESNRAVENAQRRQKADSHLEELLRINDSSSFLFNHAMGGTLFFCADGNTSETILVNDEFCQACGLDRDVFGSAKFNPIQEISPASRATMWRAAAEAREHGASHCRAEVQHSGRWIDCVMRFLGTSSRGDIFSLNIVRSGTLESEDNRRAQETQDTAWSVDMLNAVATNGFIKCSANDSLDISYISPRLFTQIGLSEVEFERRFHNSFAEMVLPEDRGELDEAVIEATRTQKAFSCQLALHYGYEAQRREVQLIGRVRKDEDGVAWLYALLMFLGEPTTQKGASQNGKGNRVIAFTYDFDRDTLVIKPPQPHQGKEEVVVEHWTSQLDTMPDNIAKASAAKVLATIRDLRHHPTSGFTDLKCNLMGGDVLRWYHVNYTCEADTDGNATVLHGYAQDANDQMGSARWWHQRAEVDYLTGLLNRNAVEQQVNLAMRTQGTGMMVMVDLDGFKRINDELGHLAGDALLRDVADAIRSTFRENDVVGRYGGDEFVAFMSFVGGDPRHIAKRRARDIIDAVHGVVAEDGTHAACSVGIAIAMRHDTTFYDLLEVADQAMYESKERGKGTYTVIDITD